MALNNYDGDGLFGQTVTAAATAKFIWDGQDVLQEPKPSGLLGPVRIVPYKEIRFELQ